MFGYQTRERRPRPEEIEIIILIPATRFKNAGDRRLAVAGPRICNTFPQEITTVATIERLERFSKHTCLWPRSQPTNAM